MPHYLLLLHLVLLMDLHAYDGVLWKHHDLRRRDVNHLLLLVVGKLVVRFVLSPTMLKTLVLAIVPQYSLARVKGRMNCFCDHDWRAAIIDVHRGR